MSKSFGNDIFFSLFTLVFYIKDNEVHFFKAIQDEKCIGCISVHQTTPKLWRVRGICVAEDYQKQGYAWMWRLAEAGLITLGASEAGPQMVLTLTRPDGTPPRRLTLPDFAWS